MQKRALGKGGPKVSALGLGCMAMTEVYGKVDEAEAIATVREALDAGADFLDTADVYGLGANESLLSRALADGYRDKAFIATKFGNVRTVQGTPGAVNGRPEYVLEACDKSLSRLGIDVIDLYYQHRVDPTVPIEETVGAMKRLVEQGKVRFIGLSEASPATLRRAHATHPVAALQTEYSLWCRFAEDEVLPTCRELGIAFVAYSPLGRGMLTGTVGPGDDFAEGDTRRNHPRFQGENLERNAAVVASFLEAAKARGVSAAALSLAWLLAQGEDILPIPGTKRRAHLRDNLSSAEMALSPAESRALADAVDASQVAGERYPAGMMSRVGL